MSHRRPPSQRHAAVPPARPAQARRPYRFAYSPDEDAAVLMTVASPQMLEARGDLFLWAFLRAEATAIVSHTRDVISRHVDTVMGNEQTYYREGSERYTHLGTAYLLRPFPEVRLGMEAITVSVTRGEWPKQSVWEAAFGLDKAGGVTVRCTGFPEGTKLLPPVPRTPRTVEDAQAIAVELVSAAVMLLVPYLEPFPETQHAGEVVAKVRESLPRPAAPGPRPRR